MTLGKLNNKIQEILNKDPSLAEKEIALKLHGDHAELEFAEYDYTVYPDRSDEQQWIRGDLIAMIDIELDS